MTVLRAVRLSLWGAVVLAFAGFGWLFWQQSAAPERAAVPASLAEIGGPFTLTDEEGRRFSSSSLAGKPFAIFFGFTHCPDVCPTSMFEMANVMQELGEVARDFKVLFVSVDPERDTPELLKAYTESFDPRIIGLTGTAAEIAAVAEAYRVHYRKVPTEGGSYTMDHTALVFLMNGQGRLAGTVAYGEPQDAALAKVRRLLAGG